VPQDLSTHAKESISLQKANGWAQSHVFVSYGKFGSLGDVGVIVKHAVCDYVVMLVCSTRAASRATITFITVRRTLTLEKFKYALESCWQTPAIELFSSAQLLHFNA
jgi:hypothetical protein